MSQPEWGVEEPTEISPKQPSAYFNPGAFIRKFEVTKGKLVCTAWVHQRKFSLMITRKIENISVHIGTLEVYSESRKVAENMEAELVAAIKDTFDKIKEMR